MTMLTDVVYGIHAQLGYTVLSPTNRHIAIRGMKSPNFHRLFNNEKTYRKWARTRSFSFHHSTFCSVHFDLIKKSDTKENKLPQTSIFISYFPNFSKYFLFMTNRPPAIIGVSIAVVGSLWRSARSSKLKYSHLNTCWGWSRNVSIVIPRPFKIFSEWTD